MIGHPQKDTTLLKALVNKSMFGGGALEVKMADFGF